MAPDSSRPRAIAAAGLALLFPCGAPAAEPPGAATPQAVVARLRAAAASGDVAELAACLAPDARAEMAVGWLVAAGMTVAFYRAGAQMAAHLAAAAGEEGVAPAPASSGPPGAGAPVVADAQAQAAAVSARYEALLARHGLGDRLAAAGPLGAGTDGPQAAAQLLAGADAAALAADLREFLGSLGQEGFKLDEPIPIDLNAALGDWVVEGDSARARAGEETLRFVRIEGRWFLAPGKPSP